jgi:hypothetical protein
VQPPAHHKPWLKLTVNKARTQHPQQVHRRSPSTQSPLWQVASGSAHEPPRPPTGARGSATHGFRECMPVRVVSVMLRGCAESMRPARLNGSPKGHPRCLHRHCGAARCSTIWELDSSGTVVWPESPATPPRRFRAATALPFSRLVCVAAMPPEHSWLLPITAGCPLLAPLPWQIRPGSVPHTPSTRGGQHPLTRSPPASTHSHAALRRNSHTFKPMPLLAAP